VNAQIVDFVWPIIQCAVHGVYALRTMNAMSVHVIKMK
jgi:hypothetical protein